MNVNKLIAVFSLIYFKYFAHFLHILHKLLEICLYVKIKEFLVKSECVTEECGLADCTLVLFRFLYSVTTQS